MSEITYTQARDGLAGLLNKVESEREPVVIARRGHESIALIPADELAGLMETAHLLRSPANAKKLLASLARAKKGQFKRISARELREKVGLNGTRS